MEEKKESLNFIEKIILEDIESGKHTSIVTRFPPEPNGYLHIGHAMAISFNFEVAEKYGGVTNLRFDDTNPLTEETEYVDGIKEDIKWLGFDWEDREYFASDYFDELFALAKKLISKGLAYVDDSTAEEIAEMKGTPTSVGTDSPYRTRSIGENMDRFQKMADGEFQDGEKVLRAKIDMAHPNLLMRDPLLYRIKTAHHHRTGDKWCIYPMYDFAHGQSDAIENVTHSLCSLEFRHHRDLYNWLIEKLEIYPSRQIEFSRMNVAYMITSKRKLKELVEGNYVSGWDDPRMPTLAGLRRRGYPPMALRKFCNKAGVTKRENLMEIELLESCVREELNLISNRVMVVVDPIRLTIKNYPEDKVEWLPAENNPGDPDRGTREMPFSKNLFIEREDFMEDAPKKFYRLSPGRNVRLKHGYIVHCESFVKNEESGEVEEVICTYYPDTKSGEDNSGIKSKGTLHWVSAAHALPCKIRQYDRLFTVPDPTAEEGKDFKDFYNHDSLTEVTNAKMEPSLEKATVGAQYQFLRLGYYAVDSDSSDGNIIFNRTVTLKDTWSKIKAKV